MISLDGLPLWAVFPATAAVVVAALEAGHRLGTSWHRRGGTQSDMSGATVGAGMGLLAFMLAFTFNSAAVRYEARRSLVIEDANAIETTWLRAGFLPEPRRTEMRRLLRDYVDLRLEAVKGGANLPLILAQSDSLHDCMWAIASNMAEKEPGSIMGGLFVQSLNEMIDIHHKRVTVGVRTRVPPTIWLALYALTAVGMLMMGIHTGLSGARQAATELALALAFSIVLFLIANLDRPQQGVIKVSQQAMTELQEKMRLPH